MISSAVTGLAPSAPGCKWSPGRFEVPSRENHCRPHPKLAWADPLSFHRASTLSGRGSLWVSGLPGDFAPVDPRPDSSPAVDEVFLSRLSRGRDGMQTLLDSLYRSERGRRERSNTLRVVPNALSRSGWPGEVGDRPVSVARTGRRRLHRDRTPIAIRRSGNLLREGLRSSPAHAFLRAELRVPEEGASYRPPHSCNMGVFG